MDFGNGFYCTSSFLQASKWTKAKMRKGNIPKGYVNTYVLNKDFRGLNVKKFDLSPSIEWLDFVVANRHNPDFDHNYDIVIGPVADDDAFAKIDQYVKNGDYSLISKERLIYKLKTFKLRDQILFHTPSALENIRFVQAKQVLPQKRRKPIRKIVSKPFNKKRKL